MPLPKVDYVLEDSTLSASGKYGCFYGQHFEKGHVCWVVGCINLQTQELLVRHYNDTIEGCLAPKAQAKQYWEEFRNKMTTVKEGQEYEPSYLENLKQYLN